MRFGVQPGALLRLNRLPSAQALHGRRQIRIPAAACGRGIPAAAAAAAATGAAAGAAGAVGAATGAGAAAPEMNFPPQALGARPGQIQRVIGSQRAIPSPPRRSVEMERDGVEMVRGVSPLVEAIAEASSAKLSAGYHPLGPQREASGLDSPRLEAQREALASMEGDSQEGDLAEPVDLAEGDGAELGSGGGGNQPPLVRLQLCVGAQQGGWLPPPQVAEEPGAAADGIAARL